MAARLLMISSRSRVAASRCARSDASLSTSAWAVVILSSAARDSTARSSKSNRRSCSVAACSLAAAHGKGRASALGFGLLLPVLSVGGFRSIHEFLRGDRLVDLLLRIPRSLLRRDSSKFEALTGDRAGAGRVRASRLAASSADAKAASASFSRPCATWSASPAVLTSTRQGCNGAFGRFHIRADLSDSLDLLARESDLLVGDGQGSGLCRQQFEGLDAIGRIDQSGLTLIPSGGQLPKLLLDAFRVIDEPLQLFLLVPALRSAGRRRP